MAGAHPFDDRLVAGVAAGGVGGFDQRPAQVVGAVLSQGAAPVALAGLVDAGGEAGVADQLARAGEAADFADLGGDRVAEHPGDPGDRGQQGDVGVVGAEPAQLPLAGCDLLVELVDQHQACAQRRRPGLVQLEPREQVAAAGAEEIPLRVGYPVLEEDRVHPVLERAAVLDQVQTEARPLTLATHARVGQPHLRDEVAAGELGQHPAVDPVGLAGQRRQPARPGRIGDPHVPAGELELVVDEAGAAHRLDHRHHLRRIAQSPRQLLQPGTIRWHRTARHPHTRPIERLPIKTLAAEIQSDIQHEPGPPFVSRGRAEFPSAGGPPSSHSSTSLPSPRRWRSGGRR